jgi:agmatinase
MKFPDYFADAESSFEKANYVIFGVPYDKTSSFRLGASRAPKEIRQASWNFETYNFRTGFDIKDARIHDFGDLNVKDKSPKDMIAEIERFTSDLLSKNKFPIAIGGEHSITPGIVRGYSKDIAVLSLDAHIDFRQKYENSSYNHACASRRIADYVGIKNISVLGIRSAEKEEYLDAKKQGLFYIDSFDIKENGIKNAIEKTKKYLGNKKIYFTLDIDVLDPAFAPGTSTPEPFGLSPFDVIDCIDSFSSNLVGFDVVEVCPDYDNGQTALLAAKIIRYVIEQIESRNKG